MPSVALIRKPSFWNCRATFKARLLVLVGHGDQHRALQRQVLLGRLLRPCRRPGRTSRPCPAPRRSSASPGPSTGSTSGNMLKGNTASLTPKCGILPLLEVQLRELLAQHALRGDPGHRDVADLRDQRHGARGPRIGLQDVDRVLADGVLDVHQPDHLQLHGDLAGVLVDRVDVLRRDADRRDDAGRVARVDAGQLDVLHDRRHEGVRAVGRWRRPRPRWRSPGTCRSGSAAPA